MRSSARAALVLAQPNSRKLALLIGINQYGQAGLTGCVTDVDLQRELLIHRCGFQPTDILSLTDQQATRKGIETAFLGHLTEQAQPGDLVLVHFSGYGSQVRKSAQAGDAVVSSLVPVNGGLPGEDANHVLLETLGLLLRSLPTQKIITVLDTSYGTPAAPEVPLLQGGWRSRSQPLLKPEAVDPVVTVEQDFQVELLERLKSKGFKAKSQAGESFPGLLLAATGRGGKALEGQWNGFSAGVWTYALTQYWWEALPATTLQVSFNQAASAVAQSVRQAERPNFVQSENSVSTGLMPLVEPGSVPSVGTLLTVAEDGLSGKVWLAGLPATVLEAYGANALLATTSPYSDPTLLLQTVAREGLSVKVRVLSEPGSETTAPLQQLQAGQPVQEVLRVLPRSLGLTVALDPVLERIERVDATSAFAGLSQVKVVNTIETGMDYLFGRVSEGLTPVSQPDTGSATSLAASSNLPQGRYGLFAPGQTPLPNTLGVSGEAVKTAVHRLTAHFRTLLAIKLLRLTVNEGTSRLKVRAMLEMVTPRQQILMQRTTLQTLGLPSMAGSSGVPEIPIGSHIQYQIENAGERSLYFMLLGLDSSGSQIVLYSMQPLADGEESSTQAALQPQVIPAATSLTIPQVGSAFEWAMRAPAGFAETYLVFSDAPFTQTLGVLENSMPPLGNTQRLAIPDNPLEVVQALLQDLHNASSLTSNYNLPLDTYGLNVNHWGTLSFIYQVV